MRVNDDYTYDKHASAYGSHVSILYFHRLEAEVLLLAFIKNSHYWRNKASCIAMRLLAMIIFDFML